MSVPTTPVHRQTLIPDALSMTVAECELPNLGAAWVFASHGIERLGHRELVVVMLKPKAWKPPLFDFPAFPFPLFREAYQAAAEGKAEDVGTDMHLPLVQPEVDAGGPDRRFPVRRRAGESPLLSRAGLGRL